MYFKHFSKIFILFTEEESTLCMGPESIHNLFSIEWGLGRSSSAMLPLFDFLSLSPSFLTLLLSLCFFLDKACPFCFICRPHDCYNIGESLLPRANLKFSTPFPNHTKLAWYGFIEFWVLPSRTNEFVVLQTEHSPENEFHSTGILLFSPYFQQYAYFQHYARCFGECQY